MGNIITLTNKDILYRSKKSGFLYVSDSVLKDRFSPVRSLEDINSFIKNTSFNKDVIYTYATFSGKTLYGGGIKIPNIKINRQKTNTLIKVQKKLLIVKENGLIYFLIKDFKSKESLEEILYYIKFFTKKNIDFILSFINNDAIIWPIRNKDIFNKHRLNPFVLNGLIFVSNSAEEISAKEISLIRDLESVNFSLTDFKIFATQGFYSFEEFFYDSRKLLERVYKICEREPGIHIVGVTRGGIALGSFFLANCPRVTISLAGCFWDETDPDNPKLIWKTPVTNFKEKIVFITTDLVRSGKIIGAIYDSIKEKNLQVTDLYVIGGHYFKRERNGLTGKKVKIITSHILPDSEFILYPWEGTPEQPSPDPIWDLKPVHKVLNNLLIDGNKVVDFDKIWAIGADSIFMSSLLSQYLKIRKIQGIKTYLDMINLLENESFINEWNINKSEKWLLLFPQKNKSGRFLQLKKLLQRSGIYYTIVEIPPLDFLYLNK